jgi:RNA polymerase sigma factor (sigma-70 family)
MVAASSQASASPHTLVAGNVELAFHVAKMYLRRARLLGLAWEDLQQEAVIGLLRAGQGFNPTYGVKFSSYAGVAIRHHLHNVLSARRYRCTPSLPTHADGALIEPVDRRTESPDAAAILADEKERVARLMRLLHPRERVIFQKYFWEDLSFAQIGAHVGLSGERVRQIFDGSLRRLRRAAQLADHPRAIPLPV